MADNITTAPPFRKNEPDSDRHPAVAESLDSLAHTTAGGRAVLPRRAAIIQSSYLPWKGYFDIIANVDVFVFLDDVQYTHNDWRNRNRFKFSGGASWLTVPCGVKRDRLICEVELDDSTWQLRHWDALKQHYSKTPHFERYRPFLEDLYMGRCWKSLSELNQYAIRFIAREILGLSTELRDSRELSPQGAKTDRLLSILTQLQPAVDVYVSGPAAKGYLQEDELAAAGMEVEYADYAGYPEYEQRFPPFRHDVSIVDLLCHVGPDAPHYIWGWRNASRDCWYAADRREAVAE